MGTGTCKCPQCVGCVSGAALRFLGVIILTMGEIIDRVTVKGTQGGALRLYASVWDDSG